MYEKPRNHCRQELPRAVCSGVQSRSEPKPSRVVLVMLTVNPGAASPQKILIKMGPLCSSHTTWCCSAGGAGVFCQQSKNPHLGTAVGNGLVLTGVSHYGWVCSIGRINCTNCSFSPRNQAFLKNNFLSNLLFCLLPFIHKGISDSSNLCPNNQKLIIYF